MNQTDRFGMTKIRCEEFIRAGWTQAESKWGNGRWQPPS